MGDPLAEIFSTTVTYLLENVSRYVVKQVNLSRAAKNLVQKLEEDLNFIKDFLKKYAAKRLEEDIFMEKLIWDISNTIYDAEDVIDTFVTRDAERKDKWLLSRVTKTLCFADISKQIQPICDKIETMRDKINEQRKKADTSGELEALEQNKVPEEKANIVGFEGEKEQLIKYLSEATEHLDVVSIIGMPGLGKTTLACKIFNLPEIKDQFPTRIWVKVSNAETKNVFLAILKALSGSIPHDLLEKSYEDLGRQVAVRLESKRFLIVLDDVRTAEGWKKLQIAFPTGGNMGKVLITSQHNEVARVSNKGERHIKMNQLTQEDSWKLLKLEVFGTQKCPEGLEHPGKLIAHQCDGVPLLIVIIGEILTRMVTKSDKKNEISVWEKVSNSVGASISDDDPTRKGEMTMLTSYEQLPYHLRNCFLYLGMFPEDFEIPVLNLIRMWIAEGFVQQKDGLSLEENAENYLKELIDRSLVRAGKKKPDGKTKTCSTSYLARYFCKTEAGHGRENFLQELKKSSTEGFQPPLSDVGKYRRVCIHSDVSEFIARRPFGGRLRSFVSFCQVEFHAKAKHVSTSLAAFKLLRVLHAQPIILKKIPGDVYQLVHLRYVTLSLDSGVLPAAFTRLRNLQTLIVYTESSTLKIEADIMKMIQLRHLKTNKTATLPNTTKSTKRRGVLQTLGAISPKSVTNEFCDWARCLKKLSIEGKVTLLPEGRQGLFNALARLSNLEKLKLLNDARRNPAPKVKHIDLPCPQAYQFPPKLKSLTLSAISLNWGFMSVLQLLGNLEILKIKDNAFTGETWEASGAGFPRLEVLHIDGFKELKRWTATARSFPKLSRLNLWNCNTLKDVPIELADITTFKLLDLRDCTPNAEAAAENIKKKKQSVKHKGQSHNTTVPFKLNVSSKHG